MKQRISLKMSIFYMIFSIFLGISVCTADVTINVPLATQEHSQWCWDASAKMILDYYGSVQTQCVIANWAWGKTTCCGNTTFDWTDSCNSPNAICQGSSGSSSQSVLSHWGVNSNCVGVLSQTTFVNEISNCRPFEMRFGWTAGGGHALVGYGYDQSGAYMDYMDPWPGNGATKSLYTWVVSASDHNWTHTLQVTTTHSCGSCPKLWYLADNGNYVQLMDMLGGAIGREQEFRSYIPLKDLGRVKTGGKITFQIREDDPEHSFIDMAKLAVVDYSGEFGFDLYAWFLEAPYDHMESLLKNPDKVLPGLRKAITVLSPLSSVHSSLGGVDYLLSRPDNWYAPLIKGENITLTFDLPTLLDDRREILFIIEGYYVRD
jgi:hypothetical protein